MEATRVLSRELASFDLVNSVTILLCWIQTGPVSGWVLAVGGSQLDESSAIWDIVSLRYLPSEW